MARIKPNDGVNRHIGKLIADRAMEIAAFMPSRKIWSKPLGQLKLALFINWNFFRLQLRQPELLALPG